MSFFGMGAWEITIILVAALVIFGPDRLPEMAGKLGKSIRDLRQMSTDLTGEFERTAGVQDLKKAVQGELTGVKSQVSSVTDSVKRDLGNNATNKPKTSTTTSARAGTTTSSTTAKSTTTTAKTATTAAKATPVKTEPPKATKKDPLADLGFFDQATNSTKAASPSTVVAKPVAAAAAKPATASTTAVSSNGSHATNESNGSNGVEQIDALARARQRRQAAGYNRRPA